jgi:hypothetical protein
MVAIYVVIIITSKSHQIYAAFAFFNLTQRINFLDINWTGELEGWISIVVAWSGLV